jgi:MFS family permease
LKGGSHAAAIAFHARRHSRRRAAAVKGSRGFTQAELAWVVSAYIVVFGGLVLLGARVADSFGRRRVFLTGTAVFGVASLLDGLAQSQGTLLGTRVCRAPVRRERRPRPWRS